MPAKKDEFKTPLPPQTVVLPEKMTSNPHVSEGYETAEDTEVTLQIEREKKIRKKELESKLKDMRAETTRLQKELKTVKKKTPVKGKGKGKGKGASGGGDGDDGDDGDDESTDDEDDDNIFKPPAIGGTTFSDIEPKDFALITNMFKGLRCTVPMPSFKGEPGSGEDPEWFVEKAADYLDNMSIKDSKRVNYIRNCLHGTATQITQSNTVHHTRKAGMCSLYSSARNLTYMVKIRQTGINAGMH